MLISADTDDSRYQLRAYSPGKLQVNEEIYTSPLIISAEKIIPDWNVDIHALTLAHFHFLDTFQVTLFLFGTGEKLIFPSADILQWFSQLKIGFECMTTAAACRTYTALASEKRKVVAGLIV
ncbi:MAG: hypothetical protein HY939_08065 [Gammaproteobacteria bacterium]|nr:hypothetical protein [Gammaproteobacteria bacterium]